MARDSSQFAKLKILAVKCPKCGVKPGVSCISYRGKVHTLTRAHTDRVQASKAQLCCRRCGQSGWYIIQTGKGEPLHMCAKCHIPMPIPPIQ